MQVLNSKTSEDLDCAYRTDIPAGAAAQAKIAVYIKRHAVPFNAFCRAKQHALAAAVAKRCDNVIFFPFGLVILDSHQIDL